MNNLNANYERILEVLKKYQEILILKFIIAHNIDAGQVLEDCLFKFKIIEHYRYRN